MYISGQLLAHNPKYSWKLETLRRLSLGAGDPGGDKSQALGVEVGAMFGQWSTC